MNVTGHVVQKHIEWPNQTIPRKYVEPILYLADRMSHLDAVKPVPSKRIVDEIAEALHMKDFRRQPWFRQMRDQAACDQLDLATARRAALVTLTLIMKMDTTRGEAAKAYFTQVRQMLDMEPIAVPSEPDSHHDLVWRYLVG